MKCYYKLSDDLFYVGYSDRRINLFENDYPVPNGISYNSYLLVDEKTALFDTVDRSVSEIFIENVEALLENRVLDYLIVSHVEPDHSSLVFEMLRRYPKLKIVCRTSAKNMLKQFFGDIDDEHFVEIEKNSTLSLGKHTIRFIGAPMVHWPEVMFSYDEYSKTLFSADAFGAFGAISGNIICDCGEFDESEKEEYRRYYANIVGKYGNFVKQALSSVSGLEIKYVCSLHGHILTGERLSQVLSLYGKWCEYQNEIDGVMIVYGSVYGGTENACSILAKDLSNLGVKNIKMFDVSVTDKSYLISEAFKFKNIVIASVTYNNGLFTKMEDFLNDFVAHQIQNKTITVIENGSWSALSGALIVKKLEGLKGTEFTPTKLKITSRVKETDLEIIEKIAKEIKESIK